MKHGFVYIWRDRKNNRFYIGCHWGTEVDGYICSSSWMKQAYKRRSEDFKRKILARIYTKRHDLLIEEGKWLSKIKNHELGKKYYNLTNHINGHWSTNSSRALPIGQKIAKKLTGFKRPPRSIEHRQHLSESQKGKKFTSKHKQKLNKAGGQFQKGNISWNKGKTHLEETRQKISRSLKGRIVWNKGVPNKKAKGTKFYNNGIIQKMFFPGNEPQRWILGRLK